MFRHTLHSTPEQILPCLFKRQVLTTIGLSLPPGKWFSVSFLPFLSFYSLCLSLCVSFSISFSLPLSFQYSPSKQNYMLNLSLYGLLRTCEGFGPAFSCPILQGYLALLNQALLLFTPCLVTEGLRHTDILEVE